MLARFRQPKPDDVASNLADRRLPQAFEILRLDVQLETIVEEGRMLRVRVYQSASRSDLFSGGASYGRSSHPSMLRSTRWRLYFQVNSFRPATTPFTILRADLGVWRSSS